MPAKSILLTITTCSILFILSFRLLPHLTPTAGATSPTDSAQPKLVDFHLVSATEGWLRLDHRLYRTKDSG